MRTFCSAITAGFAIAFATAPASVSAAAALTIRAPDGFSVKQTTPDDDPELGYEVAAVADPDTGCQVTLAPANPPETRDQARINADAASPGYPAHVAAELGDLFDVSRVDRFSMQGADGAVAVGDPKAGQGALRSAVYVLATPRGRIKVMCVAATDEFDAWLPVFERIARGVMLPR